MSGIEGVESGFWAGIRGGQKAGWISLHVLYGVSSALSRCYWVSVEIWASCPVRVRCNMVGAIVWPLVQNSLYGTTFNGQLVKL